MKKMSGTKILLIICSACFALIAAGVICALGVPKKLIGAVKELKN